MAKPGPVMMWTQYLALRSVAAAVTAFDVDLNLRSFGAIAQGICRLPWPRIAQRHVSRSAEHLRRAFPDWPEERVIEVAEGSLRNLVQFFVDVLHTPRLIHRDNWPDRIDTHAMGEAIEVLNSDRPVLLVTGHVGNFELLGYALSTFGYPLAALARPLDNPLIYDWLLGIREKRGTKIITKWDATEQMTDVLSSGGALGFIADQNAGDRGMFVPFMGRLASAYKSIGLLAMRYNATVVCGYALRREGRFDYEMGTTDIIYPSDWADHPDPLFYITARYTRAIELMIRKAPEQYWWMHRRWKSRPRYERLGKPMPGALRHHLESLPWMTPELMEQVSAPADA
ncbi:MAG: lysophospholipid acyltransferase family protein [Phycisphaerales bacterium JB063]